MGTPVDEILRPEPPGSKSGRNGSGDDEGTVVGEESVRHHSPPRPTAGRLNVLTDNTNNMEDLRSLKSPSRAREEAHRLEDDLMMLKVERQASKEEQDKNLSYSQSMRQSRSRREEPEDDFDIATNPTHSKTAVYRPPEDPKTSIGKIFKRIHNSVFLVRWIVYISPVAGIILVPLLLGALKFKNASVGGVRMDWFCIWLMIVWLSLWAGRILAKCLPWPMGLITSIFTNNSKKWRDMGKQLEIPATLFFWGLAFEISFLPTMKNHHVNNDSATKPWELIVNKILIALLILLGLNLFSKICIQLIAISFHLRTYQDRIEVNKFQIGSLEKLYEFSKQKIDIPDEEFEEKSGPASGARTPGQLVAHAQKSTMKGFRKAGDVAGRIAGDFTGRKVATSTHPHQVVLTLLATTEGSQVLARRLYRTFAREETQTVDADDLRPAFMNDEEADAAFTMFDKDLNGDISMEELEAVCVEIGRERKSITASLKDLDSVVSKLDSVFLFIVVVITVLAFISIISPSGPSALTAAGSVVLGLSWLFSATAQDFLQSIIFVFVKHPFDVGDRVTIYGNTGAMMKGDDYFVKEISLMYTEFKKMEGHVVQAPNSYLNQLFILNQRRSGGLAEAVPITVKFGTTLDQIDGLRQLLLEFVLAEKREYQGKILTELRDVTEAHAITFNVIFFYKSNWQNELLRLQRRNKFICAMMTAMLDLGIEGPRMRYPGQKESHPVYLQNIGGITGLASKPKPAGDDGPKGFIEEDALEPVTSRRSGSVVRRPRGESLADLGRRVDFSLGMSDVSSGAMTGDVFEDRRPVRLPPSLSPTREESRASRGPPSERARASSEAHRTSSVFSRHHQGLGPGRRLTRIGTDSTLARDRSNHRNRFFSRNRDRDENQAADVEAGMAGIPENSRLDPRSGLVSPAAWRASMEEARSQR